MRLLRRSRHRRAQFSHQHLGDTQPGLPTDMLCHLRVEHLAIKRALRRIEITVAETRLTHLFQQHVHEQRLELLRYALQRLPLATGIFQIRDGLRIKVESSRCHGSDHYQFGTQRADLFQRFEDGDEVTRCGTDLINCSHDFL